MILFISTNLIKIVGSLPIIHLVLLLHQLRMDQSPLFHHMSFSIFPIYDSLSVAANFIYVNLFIVIICFLINEMPK